MKEATWNIRALNNRNQEIENNKRVNMTFFNNKIQVYIYKY